MDGSQAREDWLRAIHHLQLTWNDRVIAPDHLASACEVMAAAVANDDRVLVRELLARYLDPWCAAAAERLAGNDSPAAPLVECFRADLAAMPR
jgi:TorA maturation chaperone TorD